MPIYKLLLMAVGCLVLLIITSCSTPSKAHLSYKSKIPLGETFRKLANLPYELNVYDCSQKSTEYYYALLKAGYEVRMILVPYHAFVWVKGWGYYDVTRNQYFYKKASKDPVEDWLEDWRLRASYGMLQGVITHEDFDKFPSHEFTYPKKGS